MSEVISCIGCGASVPDTDDASFVWLAPPESLGAITIIDVHRARDNTKENKRLVNEWARSIWVAWRKHQPQIRKWTSQLTSSP